MSEYRLAAIATDDAGSIEPLFDAVLAALRGEGRRVAGFIQRGACGEAECHDTTAMEDVETGDRLPIMQMLGSRSQSCRLDSDALARVAVTTITRLDARPDSIPDIMLVNRFGRAEADGGGVRAVIEKALDLGIPVLTAVSQDNRSAWSTYVGDLSNVLLPASSDAVLAWCHDALEHSKAR